MSADLDLFDLLNEHPEARINIASINGDPAQGWLDSVEYVDEGDDEAGNILLHLTTP